MRRRLNISISLDTEMCAMEGSETSMNRYALLIGIDVYDGAASLRGCVNDIDEVQKILLHSVGVPEKHLQRLAFPHAGTQHETRIASQLPLLESIRRELQRLAGQIELNALLAAIAQRTSAVTGVLDCCCSAGATRDLGSKPGTLARFLPVDKPYQTPANSTPSQTQGASRARREPIGAGSRARAASADNQNPGAGRA